MCNQAGQNFVSMVAIGSPPTNHDSKLVLKSRPPFSSRPKSDVKSSKPPVRLKSDIAFGPASAGPGGADAGAGGAPMDPDAEPGGADGGGLDDDVAGLARLAAAEGEGALALP